MAESAYDRINDYGSVKITLASPNDIRSWSFGEVRKPETINYRTYRPERDGLFCERIFGPERDWECACGKYKGTKHKGIICDRCGVKVTHSRVRRKRMGHINLAAPIVHIWFFKALPSRLGTLLGIKTSDLERIILFQEYVVVRPGETPLKHQQVLTEDEYRSARDEYGKEFEAMMGADAVKVLLEQTDLKELAESIRDAMTKTNSKQKIKDLTKRLRLVEAIRGSGGKPEWMVMDVIPVIPPDLRPLVLLESGNFATSDLNDLYRRVINRNNRLKKLIDLNAPEVIIRNEKRMLQQAVDALLDNGRCRRAVLGSASRPLKSLTDMIKGKQGRFRENLLGKRVDYSARSVIVVGPELKLNQCGLPKKIALELYQPFIIRQLRKRGLTDTIKSAKKMIERKDKEIWDILEDVIHQHPVLLNRAPTLHRMGIQAFEPVLVEGNAIKIHPLVCQGFNADFDGDQMAVHLPLSIEAQAEAHVLVLSTNNIFSPANGRPIMSPSQDIVLGIYYLTSDTGNTHVDGRLATVEIDGRKMPAFTNPHAAMVVRDLGLIGMHAPVAVRLPAGAEVIEGDRKRHRPDKGVVITTVGRCIFNDVLPEGMAFYNYPLGGRASGVVISDCYRDLGRAETLDLLDDIKTLGFHWATLAGLSFGVTDLRVPDTKMQILDKAQGRVDRIRRDFESDAITEVEHYNQTIDVWIHAREEVTKALMSALEHDSREDDPGYLNPVWLMSDSGARGNVDQIRQLAGMRGLMSKPSGEIIETPIKANFREGLTVLEYFGSTHGARKGLADTALKTADSGYLTRKLADVAQNMIITELDCGTMQGIAKSAIYKGEQVDVPLRELIIGRIARENIVNPINDEVIVRENEVITEEVAHQIEELGLETIRVRSPLTCDSPMGMCAKCYGLDLSTGQLIEEGMAVGIIGAQSIGEPGTQLTMRTFHTGGVATRALVESDIRCSSAGVLKYRDLNAAPAEVAKGKAWMALNRSGEIAVLDAKGRELEKFKVPYGALVLAADGAAVKAAQRLVMWDPHRVPMLAEVAGTVRFQDVEEGETVRAESEKGKGAARYVVIEHKGEKHPRIVIESEGVPSRDFDGEIPVILKRMDGLEFFALSAPSMKPEELKEVRDELIRLWNPEFNKQKPSVPWRNLPKLVKLFKTAKKEGNGSRKGLTDPKDNSVKQESGLIIFRSRETQSVREGYVGYTTDLQRKIKQHYKFSGSSSFREEAGKILDFHYLPSKARIEVEEGQAVRPGDLLARQPREMTGTQDITGGLPRVTELFEARKPKEPAAMAEISGTVELRTDKRRGKMTIIVRSKSEMEREHHVPHDRHLLVHTGDYIEAGGQLTEGPLVPHDILDIRGEDALQKYLLTEVQNVYRGQKQTINDKHIEVIISQMLRKVNVENIGDSQLLPGEVIDKFKFRAENERIAKSVKIVSAGDTEFVDGEVVSRQKVEQVNAEAKATGGTIAKTRKAKPAMAKTLLLGITKASLQSDSFLSAASFQESTKVFTEATLAGKVDTLIGLKENVILGHLLPAGTSFKPYLNMKIKRMVEIPELAVPKTEAEMTEAQIQQAVQRALTGQV